MVGLSVFPSWDDANKECGHLNYPNDHGGTGNHWTVQPNDQPMCAAVDANEGERIETNVVDVFLAEHVIDD